MRPKRQRESSGPGEAKETERELKARQGRTERGIMAGWRGVGRCKVV